MASATLTSKGQITIPKKVRQQLHLETGDRVDFQILDDGRVVMQPASLPVVALKGLLHKKGRRPVSVEAMHKAIARRMRKR